MSETQEVVHAPEQPVSIVQIIEKISQTPNLTIESVAVLERLVALQERRDEQERREKFFDALTRVQAQVPRILQNGLMDRGPGKGQIPYAKREDIDAVIRPMYLAEGFSITWDAPTNDESGNIHVKGRFTCHGHSETREWVCKPDASGGKTGPQAVSSTIAYGKRQIEKMFFNIIEEGKDLNGARPEDVMPITQEQADTLRTLLNDMPNPQAAFKRMYEIYSIERLEDMRKADLEDAHARIRSVQDSKPAKNK